MNKAIAGILILSAIFPLKIRAQSAGSFQEAKDLATSQGKPILMEFLRPG